MSIRQGNQRHRYHKYPAIPVSICELYDFSWGESCALLRLETLIVTFQRCATACECSGCALHFGACVGAVRNRLSAIGRRLSAVGFCLAHDPLAYVREW